MTKRAKTPPRLDDAGNPYLSAGDQIALITSDADAALAAAEADRDLARAQVAQLQMQLSVHHAEKVLNASRERASKARSERKRLADEIGERYAIDWKTHVFDRDTGRILPIEG